jgi:putative transposase
MLQSHNLLCLRQTPFVPTTTNSHHTWCVVPNLTRGIALNGLDQLWVAHVTDVHLAEEFGYLAVILDAFSRKVVGWALEAHLQAELAISALMMAIAARQPPRGALIHHSDRGVQYACNEHAEILVAYDIQLSMSRVGNPYDNAKAESFMKTLKQEEINGSSYRNLRQARTAIGAFIETVYNRLHSALAYRSPDEYETALGRLSGVAPEVSVNRELLPI